MTLAAGVDRERVETDTGELRAHELAVDGAAVDIDAGDLVDAGFGDDAEQQRDVVAERVAVVAGPRERQSGVGLVDRVAHHVDEGDVSIGDDDGVTSESRGLTEGQVARERDADLLVAADEGLAQGDLEAVADAGGALAVVEADAETDRRAIDAQHRRVLAAQLEAEVGRQAGAAHVGSEHFRAATQQLPAYLAATPRIVNATVEGTGWSELGEMAVA